MKPTEMYILIAIFAVVFVVVSFAVLYRKSKILKSAMSRYGNCPTCGAAPPLFVTRFTQIVWATMFFGISTLEVVGCPVCIRDAIKRHWIRNLPVSIIIFPVGLINLALYLVAVLSIEIRTKISAKLASRKANPHLPQDD